MFNVIVCEDNDKDLNKVISIVDMFMAKNGYKYDKHIFTDFDKSFTKISNSRLPFKIYLLDIETPSRSGIDVAREIRKKDVDSVIIFLTGHEELGNVILKNDLMFLSFINKFDDLENRLFNSLDKAIDLLHQKRVIKFEDRNSIYTLNIDDILYITKDSFERKTVIVTDYNEFKVNNSLNYISNLLDDRFIQTHRSCYVNIKRVAKIDKLNRVIIFDNGKDIDLLSDKYKRGVVIC